MRKKVWLAWGADSLLVGSTRNDVSVLCCVRPQSNLQHPVCEPLARSGLSGADLSVFEQMSCLLVGVQRLTQIRGAHTTPTT